MSYDPVARAKRFQEQQLTKKRYRALQEAVDSLEILRHEREVLSRYKEELAQREEQVARRVAELKDYYDAVVNARELQRILLRHLHMRATEYRDAYQADQLLLNGPLEQKLYRCLIGLVVPEAEVMTILLTGRDRFARDYCTADFPLPVDGFVPDGKPYYKLREVFVWACTEPKAQRLGGKQKFLAGFNKWFLKADVQSYMTNWDLVL